MTGKGWALTKYSFTVPDYLEQHLPLHSWEEERDAIALSPPASKRSATIVASPSTDGDAKSQSMVTPNGSMVPPNDAMVPPPEWRTTSPLTNPLTNPSTDEALTRPGAQRDDGNKRETAITYAEVVEYRTEPRQTAYRVAQRLRLSTHEADELLKEASS
jgi:hypothetical protein